jgi:hypothetical protein
VTIREILDARCDAAAELGTRNGLWSVSFFDSPEVAATHALHTDPTVSALGRIEAALLAWLVGARCANCFRPIALGCTRPGHCTRLLSIDDAGKARYEVCSRRSKVKKPWDARYLA